MFGIVLFVISLSAHNVCAQTQITYVDILQNLDLSLSEKCYQQFGKLFSNFSISKNSPALQMVDATSKIPSGLLLYNLGEVGNFQECIEVNYDHEIFGKYCLGTIFIDQKSDNSNQFSSGNVKSTANSPTWALCIPNGCSTADAELIGNALVNLNQFGISIHFSDFLCQTKNDVYKDLTPGAVATICFLVFLIFAVIAATTYDVYTITYKKNCPLIIKGFSAYTNSQKLFKMSSSNQDQLLCLNGIKFFSMMWVVAGHQFQIPMNGPITNAKQIIQWTDNLYSMMIVSGTLSVDTFFTVGGTLISYGFMKAKQKGVPFNLLMYYIHRYLRLTAPFAVVVLVSSTLLGYMNSGPKWPYMVQYFQKNCQDYWWSALLYVQNYINVTEMCVGQTWYLDIDMQLYIISPLILFFLWKYPKSCLLVLTVCILTIMGTSFYEAWENDLPAVLSNLYTTHSTDYQNKYYLLTHTRSIPWIIGIILGYFIFQIKNDKIKLKIGKSLVVILWILSLSILLACVFGGHSTLRSPDYDKWGNALHIMLVRPVWSLAIAWLILACTANYGGPINWLLSLPIFQVLNRFTYSIYLVHVTFLFAVAYGRNWSDYFSNFNMAYQFWGTLWFSTGLAILLVYTTESPIIVIEKILFGKLSQQKRTVKSDVEKGMENKAFEN